MVQNLWLCTSKQNLIRLILMRRWVVEPDCDWGWGADFSILDISLLFLLVLKVCLILRPLSHIHLGLSAWWEWARGQRRLLKAFWIVFSLLDLVTAVVEQILLPLLSRTLFAKLFNSSSLRTKVTSLVEVVAAPKIGINPQQGLPEAPHHSCNLQARLVRAHGTLVKDVRWWGVTGSWPDAWSSQVFQPPVGKEGRRRYKSSSTRGGWRQTDVFCSELYIKLQIFERPSLFPYWQFWGRSATFVNFHLLILLVTKNKNPVKYNPHTRHVA